MADILSSNPTIVRAAKEFSITPEEAAERLLTDGYGQVFNQLLNAALFVAQQYSLGDKEYIQRDFRLKQIKRKGKHFALRFLNAHRKFPVGEEYRKVINEKKSGASISSRVSHIRRAHWHGYWTGPKNSSQRELKIKWIRSSVVSGFGIPGDINK